jgi:transposase-like protein
MEPGMSNGAEKAKTRNLPYTQNGNCRKYKEWFKSQVAQEGLMPGASVAAVARRYNISETAVYHWRNDLRLGRLPHPVLPPGRTESFVPVGIIGTNGKLEAPKAKPEAIKILPEAALMPGLVVTGTVELYLSSQIRIRIEGNVNKGALESILAIAQKIT